MFIKSPLSKRSELITIIPKRSGKIAELGSYRGDFAAELLSHQTSHYILLIDPWCTVDCLGTMAGTQEDLEYVKKRFQKESRIAIERNFSSIYNPECTFDMVYIDGDHSFEGVTADLEIWWNRVVPGGLLAGHDVFVCDLVGVTNALILFAEKIKQNIFVINGDKDEKGHHIIGPSWYIQKPHW